MKKSAVILTRTAGGLCVAVALLAAGNLRAADTTGTSSKAADFIKEAALGNQAEIDLAQVAEQKAQNPEVKQLAQQLRDDHQQANQKVQSLAQAHGVTLDTTPGFMQKRTKDKLEKLSGAEFDKQYATAMLEDHVKDLKKYEKAAQSVQETDVKEYAQTTLEKLRQHLQHAETAARAAGVDEKTIASITKKAPDAAGGTSEKSERNTGTSRPPQ